MNTVMPTQSPQLTPPLHQQENQRLLPSLQGLQQQNGHSAQSGQDAHHYFGYLHLSGQQQAPIASTYYISLIDGGFKEHHFELPQWLYHQLQQQLKTQTEQPSAQTAQDKQMIYIRLEVDLLKQPTGLNLLKLPYPIEIVHPLYQASYHFKDLQRLFQLLQQIRTPALKVFIQSLLSQTKLMQQWVSLSASKSYHHAYPGGLLNHSLECALIVQTLLQTYGQTLSKVEQEVTLLAALLHDIGKTETLSQEEGTQAAHQAPIGYLLHHEHFNIAVLHPSLEKLKQQHPPAANALQYLLTWRNSKQPCKYIGGTLIKTADWFSTGMDVREQVFAGKPDYHFYGKKEGVVYYRL